MLVNAIGRVVPALLALLLGAALSLPASAAPARNAKAAPGDCAACHKAEKVLPAGHPATKGMKLDACAQCHAPKSEQALGGKLPGMHLHQLRGVGCAQCHGDLKKPTEVAHDKCMSCHDTTKLVEKTANVKPKNPHTSPHYGKDADCNLCHHQHAKSENYCNQCHKFEFKVP
ncbi:MAG: cytochrome c3 family protein [Burkholderiales bacterium]|jgi:hypothetical protein|nr:cytochrome c3 family protein [Burkholderiales bacterium]